MYEKLNSGDDLFDHELLEILLYSACPRVNTNPIAHALLDRFVTLPEVFNASIDELKEVDGVGESVAKFIKTVGLCTERSYNISNSPVIKSAGDSLRFVDLRLKGKSEEFVELYFVNKAGRVQRIFKYTSFEKSRATANMDVIARNVALIRPYGIIIAHNHIGGTGNPSAHDDEFTRAVLFICNMNDVLLLDHLVYFDCDRVFSFRDSGRLDRLKDNCSWETFEKWIKTLN